MPQNKLAFSVFIFLILTPLLASAEVILGNVYLMHWRTMLRAQITPQDVRRYFKQGTGGQFIAISDKHELNRLISLLNRPPTLMDLTKCRQSGTLLVVDLFSDDGSVKTFYASRFYMSVLPEKSCKSIDAEFRNSISALFD